ncbi:hypothetical protein H4219_002393 [Mycoemilia scoparia]|uniref:Uncharacterized protein n=1 Tax=Mycoemilia scoparia TaxID=417184 RepID=A0A9W7ZXN4_9FUNG|nr:hypothetical protein H4219_002393 [Mycoemilia scoparia]
MTEFAQTQSPFTWVSSGSGQVPPNAIQGGIEKTGLPLYIARTTFKNGVHPGKCGSHLSNGGFSMGWGGRELNMGSYEVLCGDVSRLKWVRVSGKLHDNPGVRLVKAGSEEDGTPLFVSKVLHHGSQHLGKAGFHLNGTNFGYGGREVVESEYYVLAYA